MEPRKKRRILRRRATVPEPVRLPSPQMEQDEEDEEQGASDAPEDTLLSLPPPPQPLEEGDEFEGPEEDPDEISHFQEQQQGEEEEEDEYQDQEEEEDGADDGGDQDQAGSDAADKTHRSQLHSPQLEEDEYQDQDEDTGSDDGGDEEQEQAGSDATGKIQHSQLRPQHLPPPRRHQQLEEVDRYEEPELDLDAEEGWDDSSDDEDVEEKKEEGDKKEKKDVEGEEEMKKERNVVEERQKEEEKKKREVEKLLAPLARDQLVAVISALAASHPLAVRDEIRRAKDAAASRRIFVGGIKGISASLIWDHYGQYGKIEEHRVARDRAAGRFAYIQFYQQKSAERALSQPWKRIDGHMTFCRPSTEALQPPPPVLPASPGSLTQRDVMPKVIYVKNVHKDVNRGRLFQFFSRYGKIEEEQIGKGKRGFAVYRYKTVEGARAALQEPTKNFEGTLLFCQVFANSTPSVADGKPAKVAVAADSKQVKRSNAAAAVDSKQVKRKKAAADSKQVKRKKVAAAAEGPAAWAAAAPRSAAPDVRGSMGCNVSAPGSAMAFPGGAMGFHGAAPPFAQWALANPVALAMMNPALNCGGAPVVLPGQVPPGPGYSVNGRAGFQSFASYHGPRMAPAPPMGPMGGYRSY